MPDIQPMLARLRAQMSRGEVALFLGAGFSTEAYDSTGSRLPSSRQLTEELWGLAFPGEQFEPSARLGDTYFAARSSAGNATLKHIQSRLTVDSESLPEFYETWFKLPWVRCYTLNIDDLELATASRFLFSRGITSISATSGNVQGRSAVEDLEVIHLNGAVTDNPENMTFSDLDYGARLIAPDPWWQKCVTEMLSRPMVFVGTELNESPLWQYIQFRQQKSPRGIPELRPGSYLISPDLNAARRRILGELNVTWVQMTAREFAESVLIDLTVESTAGHQALKAKYDTQRRQSMPQLVSDLAVLNPSDHTEYLLGQEPTWADLREGRAIQRDSDTEIYSTATGILEQSIAAIPLVITGTAGSGKSTALMRLGLRLADEGIATYWVDEESNIQPSGLRTAILNTDGPVAILVDDGDLWGATVSRWARELPRLKPGVLFAVAVRSTRLEGMLDRETVGAELLEISMPHLSDTDIDSLIDVLDRENRLGVLKGLSHEERVSAFKKEAGRQLLVAMIQATSGRLFREKVLEEFQELSPLQRQIYATLCLVSSQRWTMDRQEIIMACGSLGNEMLDAVESLARRNVITRRDIHSNYGARHRIIADEIVHAMEFRQYMATVLEGVCFAFASGVNSGLPRSNRQWRRLIRFLNHQFILQITTPDVGRHVYENVEKILHWDYHYWLQSASLEVEQGDLDLATNFLDQARSISPGERLIETEYAYLLIKRASKSPEHGNAEEWFAEGRKYLEELIAQTGSRDSYPYHALGSQGLAWARQPTIPLLEKRQLLKELIEIVKSGVDLHPRSEDLPTLAKDLEREWMMTAVVDPG